MSYVCDYLLVSENKDLDHQIAFYVRLITYIDNLLIMNAVPHYTIKPC